MSLIPKYCQLCGKVRKFTAKFPCNCNDCCVNCVTKLRFLGSLDCPSCKKPGPDVVYCADHSPLSYAQFVDFRIDHGGPPLNHSKIFFGKFVDEKLQEKKERSTKQICSKCPKADQIDFGSMSAIKLHYKLEHKLFLCDLCVAHRRMMFSEREIYKPKDLESHLRKKIENFDSEGTSTGFVDLHPLCKECGKRMFDEIVLKKHLEIAHGIVPLKELDFPELPNKQKSKPLEKTEKPSPLSEKELEEMFNELAFQLDGDGDIFG